MKLSKMWRFRSTWNGKLILQRGYYPCDDRPSDWLLWRDATTEDLVDFLREGETK